MRSAAHSDNATPSIRLVPWGIRPLAALLVATVHAAVLIRLPAPTPSTVATVTAEIAILPPGDPDEMLAAVGSFESAASKANEVLEEVTATSPEMSEVATLDATPPEALATEAEPEAEAQPAPMPVLTAPLPVTSVDTAVPVAPEELKPADRSPPDALKEIDPAPTKREAVTPTEVKKRKPEPRPKPASKKSASSPAQRGQAGSGGGQRNSSAQSVAAYAARVRSVVAARTQRIRDPGASGRVGVTFTINAAGRLASLSLRSSGNPRIDQAVRSALRGASFPPPPNGRFSGSIVITVD